MATYLADGYTLASGQVLRYTPGRVVRRGAANNFGTTFRCTGGGPSNGYTFFQSQTLTKIVWIEADGTEHEFLDTAYGGAPEMTGSQYTCATDPHTGGPNRQQVFESDDSQSITFFADANIYDDITTPTQSTDNEAAGSSGWLLFPDGSRYQTNSDGYIIQIQDGNGNSTAINYTGGGFTVTDPLNRVTTVTSSANSDTIQFPPSRTITVNWDQMGNHLRSGFSVSNTGTLFPTANSSSTQFNPWIISSVVLQDGSEYTFQYNSYGELARAVLPTGGAYEYDYPA